MVLAEVRPPAARVEVQLPAGPGVVQRLAAPVARLPEAATLLPAATRPQTATLPCMLLTAALSPDVPAAGSRTCTTPGAEWTFTTG